MLSRLSSWWARQPAAPAQPAPGASNVVPLRPTAEPADHGVAVSPDRAMPGLSLRGASTAVGLMDESEIQEFFKENWFGLGRHNGATYRTRESLDRGRGAVVASFQNAAERLSARRDVQIRRLQDALTEVDGISETTSRRLEQAIGCLERDQAKLQQQIADASRIEGWVKDAVLKYEAGFAKGLYEAVAVEMNGGAQ